MHLSYNLIGDCFLGPLCGLGVPMLLANLGNIQAKQDMDGIQAMEFPVISILLFSRKNTEATRHPRSVTLQ